MINAGAAIHKAAGAGVFEFRGDWDKHTGSPLQAGKVIGMDGAL
jgi:hypothetical protein